MPKLAILLTKGYADWECAFITGIGRAYYGLEIRIFSPDGAPIVSQGGLQTTPDEALENLTPDAFDILVICGGGIWETEQAPEMSHLVDGFLEADKHVAAICGATLALAKAGVLDDRKHTSNALEFLAKGAKPYRGMSHYVNTVTAIEDQRIITAPGHAPAHFSAAVFKAAGIDENTIAEFLGMLSAEHNPFSASHPQE